MLNIKKEMFAFFEKKLKEEKNDDERYAYSNSYAYLSTLYETNRIERDELKKKYKRMLNKMSKQIDSRR